MQRTLSGQLKVLFLIHAIVGIVIGLALLLIPAQLGAWLNVTIEADFTYRLIGAAILSFGLSSMLAYRRTSFEQVQLILETEIAWTLFAVLALLWAATQLEVVPAVAVEQEWMMRFLLYSSSALMGVFFVAFGYFFLTEEATETVQTQERDYAHR